MRRFYPRSVIQVLTLALAASAAVAQSAPAPEDAPTLHVYVNLMQIPVLLLDPAHRPLPPMPQSRFKVNIEGLKQFEPARVRQQGDDPISLAILLDSSDPDEYLWEKLGAASVELSATLREHDRVEVYGIDGCKMRQFLQEGPFHAADLQLALSNAAATKAYELQKKRLGPCPTAVSLWDALLYTALRLEQRNGRRILMVLSNARQKPEPTVAERLHRVLNTTSATMFGIQHGDFDSGSYALLPSATRFQPARSPVSGTGFGATGRGSPGMVPVADGASDAPLQTLTEMSGGMLLGSSVHSLPKTLAKVIDLARGRYIVEFPRPAELPPGGHVITVAAGSPRNFIRPAGISVPQATADELAADPTVEHGALAATAAATAEATVSPAATQAAEPAAHPQP